jgi:hypothetical protein
MARLYQFYPLFILFLSAINLSKSKLKRVDYIFNSKDF